MHDIHRFLTCTLLLTACASLPPEPDSASSVVGEKAARFHLAGEWRELKSAHFTLTTDRDPADARRALQELERVRAALLAAVWPRANLTTDRVQVTGLRMHDGLHEFGSEGFAGFVRSGAGEEMVVAGDNESGQRVVAHELVHHLSIFLSSHQPVWFSEGLATLFETIKIDDDNAWVETGHPDQLNLIYVKRRGRMPTAQLIRFSPADVAAETELSSFYSSAWLLTLYLFNEQPAALRDLQIRLGHGEEPVAAFSRALPTLSAEGVDKELTLYLKYGGYKVRHVAFAWEPQPILAERELSEPEVHAVRALLFLDHPGAGSQEERIAKAKVELAPAIAAEPLLPAVLAVQTRFEKPAELLERARQSTQKFPSDARAWSVLAQVLGSDVATRSERIEAYAKANALDPDDAFRLNTYAWALVESGRYAEAVAPARRSVQLAPSSSNLDTLGAALAGSGQCAEALVMEQRAVEAIRPEAPARHQQAIAKNLMQIKEHCQPRP